MKAIKQSKSVAVKKESKISFKNKRDFLKQLGNYASHEDNSWNADFLRAVIGYCKKNLKTENKRKAL